METKEKVLAKLGDLDDIDLEVLAEHDVFTVPDGVYCYVHRILMKDVSQNTNTVKVCAGFGTADADDVVAITGALTVTQWNWITGTAKSNAARGEPGDVFKIQIETVEDSVALANFCAFGHFRPI